MSTHSHVCVYGCVLLRTDKISGGPADAFDHETEESLSVHQCTFSYLGKGQAGEFLRKSQLYAKWKLKLGFPKRLGLTDGENKENNQRVLMK